MTIEEIKQYLDESKDTEEVKAFIQGLNPITLERLQTYVRTDKNAMGWFDSEKDKHMNKSLETWKTNNLQGLVDQKVKELYPEDDPKDLELKKMQAQIEKIQQESKRKELTNHALLLADEMKLPKDIITNFLGDDEESTKANLEGLQKVFNSHVDVLAKERLEDSAKPDTTNNNNTGTTNFMDTILQNQVKRD